jgi:UDP-2,3-diacylglucosamine pyrophosphatase LpxH
MYDAIIISDLHLGSDICRVDKIIEFLENLPETHCLILNGDVLESTEHRLKRDHWKVLSLLRKLSDKTDIIYTAGNHDNDASGIAHLIGAEFVPHYILESGDSRILCIHGDKWDNFITDHPVITWFADYIYLFLQYWHSNLAVYLKHNSKTFLRCAQQVKDGALKLAQKMKCDKVFCGHVHMATNDITYYNSGSWTEEDCHFILVEDGFIELVKFSGVTYV